MYNIAFRVITKMNKLRNEDKYCKPHNMYRTILMFLDKMIVGRFPDPKLVNYSIIQEWLIFGYDKHMDAK